MTALTRSAASALTILSRRVVLAALFVASAVFAAVSTVVTLTTATDDASPASPPGATILTRAALEQADGIAAGLTGAATFLGIVAIALAAHAMASEVQLGTLRALLVRQPRRAVLLTGKAIAVGALVVAVAVLATGVSIPLALGVAPGQDVATAAWSAGEAAAGAGRLALALVGYALLGLCLGVLLRSPTAAIGAGVAWVLAVEQVIAAASSSVGDLLPGQALGALADGSASASQGAALAVVLIALTSVATRRFVVDDVRC